MVDIREAVDSYKPQRFALDSLSALVRTSTLKDFREFVVALTSFIKSRQITGLFTATTPPLTGAPWASERHISTITDTIIMLRYVELFVRMRRG